MTQNSKNNKGNTNKQKSIVIPKKFLEKNKIKLEGTFNRRGRNQFQKIKYERPDAVEQTLSANAAIKGVPYVSPSDNSSTANIIRLSNAKGNSPARDYYRNKKMYDEQFENYIALQKKKERFAKNSKIADLITSDPNYITKSAAPMDNTIIHFDKPLEINDGKTIIIGPTSTEILTPQQQLASLTLKPLPETPVEKVLAYAPTAAVAAPIAYMVGSGGVVPLATSIWNNPISWAASAAGGWLGTEGVNSGIRLFTDYNSWGDMMADTKLGKYVINKLGPDVGKPVLEFTNVGGIGGGIKGWNVGLGIEKRGAEVFMRSTPMSNPLIDIKRKALNTPAEQYAAITKYVLFNLKNKKVPYKFLGKPDELYTGIHSDDLLEGDVIDAFLYGKDMHPDIGIKVATGEDFGPHEAYIREAYPTKASKIPVYELSVPPVDRRVIDGTTSRYGLIKDTDLVVPDGQVYGSETSIALKDGRLYDSAGHYVLYGNSSNGTRVLRHLDIWKFNPKEYYNKWLSGSERPYWEKLLLKYGLNFVDSHGTPVVARTPWLLYDTNTY